MNDDFVPWPSESEFEEWRRDIVQVAQDLKTLRENFLAGDLVFSTLHFPKNPRLMIVEVETCDPGMCICLDVLEDKLVCRRFRFLEHLNTEEGIPL